MRNAAVRAASLLPKQLRNAKARHAELVKADKEWAASGSGKKAAAESIAALRAAGSMDEEALKKLEASILTQPGLSSAIRQVRRRLAGERKLGWSARNSAVRAFAARPPVSPLKKIPARPPARPPPPPPPAD